MYSLFRTGKCQIKLQLYKVMIMSIMMKMTNLLIFHQIMYRVTLKRYVVVTKW